MKGGGVRPAEPTGRRSSSSGRSSNRQQRRLLPLPRRTHLATVAATHLATVAAPTQTHLATEAAHTPATSPPATTPYNNCREIEYKEAGQGSELSKRLANPLTTFPQSAWQTQTGSSLPLSCGRLANPPTAFPQSARQTRTGPPLSLYCGRTANPPTVLPQSARQTQTGSPLPYCGPAWQTPRTCCSS